MKRKVIALLAFAGLLFCCVQAVREEKQILQFDSFVDESSSDIYENLVINEISAESPEEVDLEECSLQNKIALIAQIARASELSENDMRNIGQTIIYVEMRYLGVQKAPTLEIGDYECSFYDAAANTVYVSSKEKIRDHKSYIQKILHLSYHAYEYEQTKLLQKLRQEEEAYANLLIFEEAIYWEEDLYKYTGCNTKCKNLYLETSAEVYSLLSCQEYLDMIREYWKIDYKEDQQVKGEEVLCTRVSLEI